MLWKKFPLWSYENQADDYSFHGRTYQVKAISFSGPISTSTSPSLVEDHFAVVLEHISLISGYKDDNLDGYILLILKTIDGSLVHSFRYPSTEEYQF